MKHKMLVEAARLATQRRGRSHLNISRFEYVNTLPAVRVSKTRLLFPNQLCAAPQSPPRSAPLSLCIVRLLLLFFGLAGSHSFPIVTSTLSVLEHLITSANFVQISQLFTFHVCSFLSTWFRPTFDVLADIGLVVKPFTNHGTAEVEVILQKCTWTILFSFHVQLYYFFSARLYLFGSSASSKDWLDTDQT